ncbi:MAG: ABC transporter substrate-binding protein [Burkholderiales bacterium]|nr:ABC transporter substrate-binding protein [Burkholderiales bacterium]
MTELTEKTMTVTLIENFRAVFYTPFYAAFALRAWEAENLEVVLRPSAAADQTLKTIMSGTGQVSWGGPMRLMHALDDAPDCGVVAFCEVVCRDPFYLIGGKPNPKFRMNDLKSGTLATVSEVPTPWYCLQHDLRLAGIDPATISRTPARTMAENATALRAGEVDVIQVFEPFARNLVDEGAGHVWYAAAARGPAAYTTLNSTRNFIARDPDTVLRMTRAMYRTQKWIAAHDDRELAELVASYLPDVPLPVLAACYAGYKTLGLWNTTPVPHRSGLEWLRDAMLSAGAIKTKFAYEDVVNARFAEQAVREDPSAA